jgi:hypothetical protein
MEATILTALLAIGISALVVIRLNGDSVEKISDEIVDGDWPAIPEELRAARAKSAEGGVSVKSGGRPIGDSHCHRGAAN